MAIGDPYITKDELRSYLQIQEDVGDFDARLADAVASASREVEQFCGRQFNQADVATPRRYEVDSPRSIRTDDFYSTTGLVVDRGNGFDSWSAVENTGYIPAPYDGVVDGIPWPYYRLEFPDRLFARTGRHSRSFVRVTALWGWPAVPATIKQATFQIAAQTFRLADAPLGVTGNTQYGGVVRVQDLPVVATKLMRYKTDPILVG